MEKRVPTTELKSALKDFKYRIEEKNGFHTINQPASKKENESSHTNVHTTSNNAYGKYYCPMAVIIGVF
ncbi:MAG: hypothetical protein M3R50_02750 [Bacteroidota bacterium]|nr:hypothetical protein [Bacteroidota bacterium]